MDNLSFNNVHLWHFGDVIDGRYILSKSLGQGSYGHVWSATDTVSKEIVAIKLYRSKENVPNWECYVKTLSDLQHPNLVKVISSGIWKGCPYIVMEYFEEGDAFKLVGKLRPCLEDERLIWHFIHDVAGGLAYLHGKNLFHQDIKLTNILMNKGHFVIADYETLCRVEFFSDAQSTVPFFVCPGLHPFLEMDFWPMAYSVYELASGESALAHHKLEIHPLSFQWSEALRNFLQEDSGYPTLNGRFVLLAEEILKSDSLEVFYSSKETNVSPKKIIDLKSHVLEEKADGNTVSQVNAHAVLASNHFDCKITPEMEQCLKSIRIAYDKHCNRYGIIDVNGKVLVGYNYDKIEPFRMESWPGPGPSCRFGWFVGAFFHQGNDVGYLRIMEDGSIEVDGKCSKERYQKLCMMT